MKQKMYLQDTRPKALAVFETLVQIAVVSALGLFIAKYLFFSSTTESRSMEPTVVPNSVVFTNRTAYLFTKPERFDVVAFSRTGEEESDILIRRVIGLPGETIQIERGVVYINGAALDLQNYVSEITSDGIARNPIRLGEDEYFVLGDTPANSEDSRSSTIGTVPMKRIRGRVWLNARSITELGIIR